jgi:hypothetical protein
MYSDFPWWKDDHLWNSMTKSYDPCPQINTHEAIVLLHTFNNFFGPRNVRFLWYLSALCPFLVREGPFKE